MSQFDNILEIQKQVFSKLSTDAGLSAVLTGVFDFIPQNQAFPFVRIGDQDISAFNTQSDNGFQSMMNIHVWHRPEKIGRAEILQIQSMIYELLHRTDFTLTNASVLSMMFDFSNIIVEPDAVTYHGIQRFKLLIGGY